MTVEELLEDETGDESCPVCATACPTRHADAGDVMRYACRRCGPFRISQEAEENLRGGMANESRVQLSGWCRDQQLEGRMPLILQQVVADSAAWLRPKLVDRAARLLRWIVMALDAEPNDFDRVDKVERLVFFGASYSRSKEELAQLRRILEESGELELHRTKLGSMTMRDWLLTAKGRIRAEGMEEAASLSSSAFVAMWFHPDVQQVWTDAIRPAIAQCGYDPVRVDEVEHVGRIDDQIMLEIKRSKFIVADFTGHRGGVYFEAGYAVGLGIPVFWTCREDHLAQLHFDIRQYNCLVWNDPATLFPRLRARIENVVGIGPRGPG